MKQVNAIPIGSVVIPAHNESHVIRRCLGALLDDMSPGELDVVVVCNGCSDDTADIVRSTWPGVQVMEIAEASKPAALRAADRVLTTFPRIYLDADVILSSKTARILIESLHSGSIAARPHYIYDTSRSDAMVRSYYRTLARVQSSRNSLWGGVYALSQRGRSRFATFPELIADDLFVDQCFTPSEIDIVTTGPPAVITVQRRFRDLVRVTRRRRKGNAEMTNIPNSGSSTTSSTISNLLSSAKSGPTALIDTIFYFTLAAILRISVAVSPPSGWSRDESSREALAK